MLDLLQQFNLILVRCLDTDRGAMRMNSVAHHCGNTSPLGCWLFPICLLHFPALVLSQLVISLNKLSG